VLWGPPEARCGPGPTLGPPRAPNHTPWARSSPGVVPDGSLPFDTDPSSGDRGVGRHQFRAALALVSVGSSKSSSGRSGSIPIGNPVMDPVRPSSTPGWGD